MLRLGETQLKSGGAPRQSRKTPASCKVAVFTDNRAEYGLQYPILKAIAEDLRLDFCLLVSGAHLKEDFRRTVEKTEADGFSVYGRVKIDMPDDTPYATAQAIGSGVVGLSRVLDTLRPDFLVVYADRFEGFAADIAGYDPEIKPLVDKPMGVSTRYADTTAAKAILGWQPKISLEEGFRRVYQSALQRCRN